ncbi:MAG: pyruvate, phosphate dikinase, partial [Actinomycetota bacterium]|nr:pyruvate, phosphate dikinase [Actinomycetota bacterium]
MKASEDRRTDGETAEAGTDRFVYGFSDELGLSDVLALCGGKGSGLMRMRGLGLPVPEGFVITTEACVSYIKTRQMPGGLLDEVKENLKRVEEATGRGFGDPKNPLLVSVRSGAAVSMPGMMDTVLNLGLNDATVLGLAESTGDERFARDSHRRFIQAFGEIVLKAPGHLFEDAIEEMKVERGVEADTELASEDLEELAGRFKEIIAREAG